MSWVDELERHLTGQVDTHYPTPGHLAKALDPQTVSDTIGVLLKYQDDIARIASSEGAKILDEVKAETRASSA